MLKKLFHNALGGSIVAVKRGLIGKTIENGFDLIAVHEGKGRLKKQSNLFRVIGKCLSPAAVAILSSLPDFFVAADSPQCDSQVTRLEKRSNEMSFFTEPQIKNDLKKLEGLLIQ